MKNGFWFMGKNGGKVILLLLLVGVIVISRMSGVTDYLTFDAVKEHRGALKDFVSKYYGLSVIIYIAAFLSTSLFFPGAVALMLVSGFLFGVLQGVLYVNVAATSGAALAFLSSRYLIGRWIQERFASQLRSFNREIECHGRNYLLFLRIVPVFPFFVVNYLSGITKIPLGKFVWTTSLGLLPGSVLYAYAGRKLGEITQVQDLLSAQVVAAFFLLGLFALLPVAVRLRKRGTMAGRTR